jgi:hypothetical protein
MPFDVVPREPFVQLLTAHAETLGVRVQTGEIRLDEVGSLFHRTGYLPKASHTLLPENQCHPCSRSVLSPMCPACTPKLAGSLRLAIYLAMFAAR